MIFAVRSCVALLVIVWSVSAHAAEFFFKDGDVVVMVGDSITEQHLYSNYVELWTVTRFPEWKDGLLSFSRLDGALPFFPEDAAGILPWASILEELNDYRLKVTGLPAGMYAIQLGGTRITEISAEQLATGTNLAAAALQTGPIADQGKAVRMAVENKNRYHHDMIFRGIVLSSVPEWIYSAVPQAELEVKKQAVIQERLTSLVAMDAERAHILRRKAHTVQSIPTN